MRISDWSSDVCSSDLLLRFSVISGKIALPSLRRHPLLTLARPSGAGHFFETVIRSLDGPASRRSRLFQRALERVLVLASAVDHLRNLGFGHFIAERPAHPDPALMDVPPDRKSTRPNSSH